MSLNSSSSNASESSSLILCSDSPTGSHMFSAFAATNALLLLPLSALVLYVGFQRWRRQRTTSATTVTSHIDVVTYHMVAMEIYSLVGTLLFCIGIYVRNWKMQVIGYFGFSVILPGQALFHCLTCVERYLAVVHPVTYRGLRQSGGVRIRNISVGCVWLLCAGWMALTYVKLPDIPVTMFSCLFALSLLVSSFCSLSVLRALTRRSPGERAGVKERAGQAKRRVFHTIMAIMGVLLLRFSGLMVCMVVFSFVIRASGDGCVVLNVALWFCLPSSLVLPLLFLHRAGKLLCCKKTPLSVLVLVLPCLPSLQRVQHIGQFHKHFKVPHRNLYSA